MPPRIFWARTAPGYAATDPHPHSPRLTDFDDLFYTSKCAIPRKEMPFGGLDDNPKYLGGEIPKTPIFGPE